MTLILFSCTKLDFKNKNWIFFFYVQVFFTGFMRNPDSTLVYQFHFSELRQKLPPKILLSFCVSLLLLLVVFLVGIERTKHKIGCQTVAASLHYFILSTFFWMATEAVNLHRKFVKVFRAGSDKKFFISCSIFALG